MAMTQCAKRVSCTSCSNWWETRQDLCRFGWLWEYQRTQKKDEEKECALRRKGQMCCVLVEQSGGEVPKGIWTRRTQTTEHAGLSRMVALPAVLYPSMCLSSGLSTPWRQEPHLPTIRQVHTLHDCRVREVKLAGSCWVSRAGPSSWPPLQTLRKTG